MSQDRAWALRTACLIVAVLLVAAMFALSTGALGQSLAPAQQPTCLPAAAVEGVTQRIVALYPDARVDRLEGRTAALFLKHINTLGEPTDWVSDTVVTIRFASGMGWLALISNDKDCMPAFAVPAEMINQALVAARGISV